MSGNVVRKAPVLLARRGSSVETSRSSARTLRPPPITRRRRRGLCLPMPFIRAASVLNVGDPPPEEIGEQSRIGPRLDVDPGPPLSAEVSRDARNNVAATGPTNGGFLVTIGQRRPDDAVYRARTGRPKSREQRRVGARPTGEAPVALRPLARASRPKPSRRKGARRTDRSFRIAACSALPGPFMATRERSSAVCAGGLVTRIRLGRAEDVRLIRSQAFHHRRICWRVDHPEMPPPGLLPVDKRNHAFQTCRLLNWPS